MKLKTNNTAKKPTNAKKNKSPKKQSKGVEVRKDKPKVVNPNILKKEGEKVKVETPLSPQKILQRELWEKAIENVSNMSNLSDEESSIVKLLADFKKKSSVPQRSIKLKNFITKGFSKYKDTSDDVLDGIYNKLLNEFKSVGGVAETIEKKVSSKKTELKTDKKPKSKTEDSDDEKMEEDDDEENEDDVEDDDNDDELEGDLLGKSDDDDDDDDEGGIEEEEEDEEEEDKPIVKGIKANNKNGKGQPNKGKNGSKFKGGKVQKNKKFGKKK